LSCRKEQMSLPAVEVNGQLITAEEIRAAVSRQRQQAEANGCVLTLEERLKLRETAVESLIDRKLLLEEALRLDVPPSDKHVVEAPGGQFPSSDTGGCRSALETEQLDREVADDLLLRNLIDWWSREIPPPKPVEVREFYRKNRGLFWTDELAWAAHIVKHTEGADGAETRVEMERLRERVQAGEALAEVAAAASDCPENSGDLGYFARGTMVEEFEDVIFSSSLNELTPVFETRFGFHIAIVYDRKPKGVLPFNDVISEVERLLVCQKQDREIGRRLAVMRSRAVIKRI